MIDLDEEFELISSYIKYRMNKFYDIYSPSNFTNDSTFYRKLIVYWIPEFKNKDRWLNELKYMK